MQQNNKLFTKMRPAFISIDAMIAISLAMVFSVGYLTMKRNEERSKNITHRHLFLQEIDRATLQSFNTIIDAYAPKLHTITDSDSKWGWNDANKVSPFPTLSTVGGIKYLKYQIDTTVLTGAKLTTLKQEIISNYRNICSDLRAKVGSSSDIYLYCPLLEELKYDTTDGSTDLASPFTLGGIIDPDNVPTAKISYRKYDSLNSSYTTETYLLPYNSVYDQRKNVTAQKIIDIRNMLEEYATTTKLKEIANVENADGSGGLNNSDDEMIAWHWKSYGDSKTQMDSTYCNKSAGGGDCSNLDTSNIWRSGTNIQRGLIVKRIADNFFIGDTSMFLDGFGNGIYIHPNGNDCTGSDISTCAINAQTLPKDGYVSIGNPPYVSIVYTDAYKSTSKSSAIYGKMYMTY